MARDFKKEAAWEKKVYKQYIFKCRTDNGDVKRMESVLKGRTFADWVREKLKEELNNA